MDEMYRYPWIAVTQPISTPPIPFSPEQTYGTAYDRIIDSDRLMKEFSSLKRSKLQLQRNFDGKHDSNGHSNEREQDQEQQRHIYTSSAPPQIGDFPICMSPHTSRTINYPDDFEGCTSSKTAGHGQDVTDVYIINQSRDRALEMYGSRINRHRSFAAAAADLAKARNDETGESRNPRLSSDPMTAVPSKNDFLREADDFKTHLENLGILTSTSYRDRTVLNHYNEAAAAAAVPVPVPVARAADLDGGSDHIWYPSAAAGAITSPRSSSSATTIRDRMDSVATCCTIDAHSGDESAYGSAADQYRDHHHSEYTLASISYRRREIAVQYRQPVQINDDGAGGSDSRGNRTSSSTRNIQTSTKHSCDLDLPARLAAAAGTAAEASSSRPTIHHDDDCKLLLPTVDDDAEEAAAYTKYMPPDYSTSCSDADDFLEDDFPTYVIQQDEFGNENEIESDDGASADMDGRWADAAAAARALLLNNNNNNNKQSGGGDGGGSSGLSAIRTASNYDHALLQQGEQLQVCSSSSSSVPQPSRDLVLDLFDTTSSSICKPRSLSQKYRPRTFGELLGRQQSVVARALSNAIDTGKIAPVYLFQGPRGTGKTTAARIFAGALVCGNVHRRRRPCGDCRDCVNVFAGRCSCVKEVDAASNNGVTNMAALVEDHQKLQLLMLQEEDDEQRYGYPADRDDHDMNGGGKQHNNHFYYYKIFIVDECHALTSETWTSLLRLLEEPPPNVVFLLITTDPARVPATALSRCQRFLFPKIREAEIVDRLRELAAMEELDVEADTLRFIASRSDGSLRDAETMLDQLSLLAVGGRIDPCILHELVGSASDERLLHLLDSALRVDTVSTVSRVRELLDSGVEPVSLTSQLASMIADILAGTFDFSDKQLNHSEGSFFFGFAQQATPPVEKVKWLRIAMKTLSDAEKQVRASNDKATWLTAALLQLGPTLMIHPSTSSIFVPAVAAASITSASCSLSIQSSFALDDTTTTTPKYFEGAGTTTTTTGNESQLYSSSCRTPDSHDGSNSARSSSCNKNRQLKPPPAAPEPQDLRRRRHDPDAAFISDTKRLDDIWFQVLQKCRSLTLRQILHSHGELVSVVMTEAAAAVVHVEMERPEHKSACYGFQRSIGNAFESVLGVPVELHISSSLPSLWMEAEDGGAAALEEGGDGMESSSARSRRRRPPIFIIRSPTSSSQSKVAAASSLMSGGGAASSCRRSCDDRGEVERLIMKKKKKRGGDGGSLKAVRSLPALSPPREYGSPSNNSCHAYYYHYNHHHHHPITSSAGCSFLKNNDDHLTPAPPPDYASDASAARPNNNNSFSFSFTSAAAKKRSKWKHAAGSFVARFLSWAAAS